MAKPLSQLMAGRRHPGGRKHASGNKRSPQVHAAQQRVHDALNRGEIKKPKRCSRCGRETSKLEASHNSYGDRLNITWLCPSCHRKQNRRNPKS